MGVGLGRGHPNRARRPGAGAADTVHCRTVLVLKSLDAVAVVQTVSWSFHSRSVFFQNAVRLAVGLAAARLVAGLLDLSHGFWMLLATHDIDAYVGSDHTLYCPSRISRNNRWRISRRVGPRLSRRRFGGV